MGVDLTLIDVTALWWDDEFNGVFKRNDVILALGVDGIDKSGEGGGFTTADGAGDEDEAVVITDQGADSFWQTELLDTAHLGLDDAEDHVDAEALIDDGGAKTAITGRIGEIDVSTVMEHGFLIFGEEAVSEPFGVLWGQNSSIVPNGL